jgi:hypothetical protein
MYTLIVKGNADQAIAATQKRGIEGARVRNVLAHVGHVILDVFDNQASADVLNAWFTEPVAAVPGEGFPSGSLLHWSTRS